MGGRRPPYGAKKAFEMTKVRGDAAPSSERVKLDRKRLTKALELLRTSECMYVCVCVCVCMCVRVYMCMCL